MRKDRRADSGSLPAKKRKRGGQLNNNNAYKHGFYSKHFKAGEKKALPEAHLSGLVDVIDILRIGTLRVMEAYTQSMDDLDYKDQLTTLRILGLSGGSIASLTRLQLSAGKNAKEANAIIEKLSKIGENMFEEAQQNQE